MVIGHLIPWKIFKNPLNMFLLPIMILLLAFWEVPSLLGLGLNSYEILLPLALSASKFSAYGPQISGIGSRAAAGL